ncbi:MAG: hypothetical protein QM831_10560 [Kofleriaceae bacterium]
MALITMNDRTLLRDTLSRELVHAEHDARIHTRRLARRLGDTPPGNALMAISEHAAEVEPSLAKLCKTRTAGTWLGDLIAQLKFAIADRFATPDRAFRATLAELKRGVDAARLLREVVELTDDIELMRFCDLILVERLCLIEDAEHALVWFAEHPERHLLPQKTVEATVSSAA